MSVDNLKNMDPNRVVVTDASVVTGLGNNLESLWQGLMANETAIRPITRFPVDQDHYKAKIAAHINDLEAANDRSMLHHLLDRLFLELGSVPSDSELITATIKAGADNLESFCRGGQANFQDVLLSSIANIVGPGWAPCLVGVFPTMPLILRHLPRVVEVWFRPLIKP